MPLGLPSSHGPPVAARRAGSLPLAGSLLPEPRRLARILGLTSSKKAQAQLGWTARRFFEPWEWG